MYSVLCYYFLQFHVYCVTRTVIQIPTLLKEKIFAPNSCVHCSHPDKALEPPNAMVRWL